MVNGHILMFFSPYFFSLLGTPPDEEWPDSSILASSFQPRAPKNLEILVPGIDPVGLSLLESMLVFDHHKRITAHNALRHPYFEGRVIPEIDFPPMPPRTLHMSNLASTAAPSTSTARSIPCVASTSSTSIGGYSPNDSGYSSFIRDTDTSRK